jgi:predicted Fe-Mo cluster-binding NifX family protein
MILSFCLTDDPSDSVLDERFGRCARFAIINTGRDDAKRILPNPGGEASISAGTGAVQLLVNEGVEGLIAPHLGPKAEDARRLLGIRLWNQGTHSRLEEALAAWRSGELEEITGNPAGDGQRGSGLYRP